MDKIIIDSREQDRLVFNGVEIEVRGLDIGDYALAVDDDLIRVRVERKSKADLFNSFVGDNYRREKAKIKKAHDQGLIYILAVECTVPEVLKGHYYYAKGGLRKCKKPGTSQHSQIETMRLFGYFDQVLWCVDRNDMAYQVKSLLFKYKKYLPITLP